jgi:hypothetical protein
MCAASDPDGASVRGTARIGDTAGVVVTVDGRPVSMMAFTVADGAVRSIHAVIDPARLARLIPSWVR